MTVRLRARRAALIVPLFAALALTAVPALGQSDTKTANQATGPQTAPSATDSDASAISANIFGTGKTLDAAYGAYQRGYFLTALSLALPRAQKDDAPAQTLIAELYANGLGVPQNLKKAAAWYELADKNGDVNATFALAMMYEAGRGVAKDMKKTIALLEKAAKGGQREAQYNLALLYVDGTDLPPNEQEAADLMQKAAKANLPEARYDYGIMLIEGAGVIPDTAEGARQIALAAGAGLPEAEVEYATLLYLGKGIAKDHAEAVKWYERAANQGSAVAQNRLAKLLAVGEGVEKDLESAVMWQALAKRQGLNDPKTDELLANVPQKIRDAGEERARYWPAPPPQAIVASAPAHLETPQEAAKTPPFMPTGTTPEPQ